MTVPAPAMLHGAGTALVTPFLANGDIDEAALRRFVSWQLEEGIDFVVPCGSTGEAMTMSPDEQRRVVEITVSEVAGRVPVVAGAGSNDTKKAIELSKMMKAAGATHLLHTSPMYNKPPQRGILAHFRAIADAVDIPVILYNVPSRTASNMEAETTLALAEHANIVAVKEASANIPQVAQIARHRPHGFAVLSGDDAFTLSILAHGGDGVISVTSNIAPALLAQLCAAFRRGDVADARNIDDRLSVLTSAAFIESNPIPAKAALAMMGLMQNVLRLPLIPLSGSHTQGVRAALTAVGALSE
jgi:4-hydroxy-tetrahydrodipicolinate synthase